MVVGRVVKGMKASCIGAAGMTSWLRTQLPGMSFYFAETQFFSAEYCVMH